jgi:predicted nucleic acid-binding protein
MVVTDACPVIFLAKLDRLALIRELFPGSILVPASVRQELSQSVIPLDEQRRIREFLKHCRIEAVRSSRFSSLALSLPDRHVLTLARKHPNALVLTDDSLVRRIARAEGLPVAGTLGILIRAVRVKLITQQEALQAVDELVAQHRLRISVELYQETIRQIRPPIAGS